MGLRSMVGRLRPKVVAEEVEPFDGTRTVKVGEATYTVQSDRDLYLESITGEFEPDLAQLFKAVVKPGGVAIDVGANIGFTAILLGQIASRVIAYEVAPSTFPFLEQNIARSGHDTIEVLPVGLGAVAGAAELTSTPGNRSGTFIADHETADRRYHTSEQAEIRTLDAEVERLGLDAVDFLKIDVEGFEMFVIQGGRATLSRFHPVVVMEMNHWCLNAFQRIALPDFLDFVLGIFPLAYAVQGNEYLDLHDPDRRYDAMHKNIVDNSFMNLVAAFEESQLAEFSSTFTAL
jgi:FkbM family methyltransferase